MNPTTSNQRQIAVPAISPHPELEIFDTPVTEQKANLARNKYLQTAVFCAEITPDLFTVPPQVLELPYVYLARGREIVLPNKQKLVFHGQAEPWFHRDSSRNQIIIPGWAEMVHQGQIELHREVVELQDMPWERAGSEWVFTKQKAMLRIPFTPTLKIMPQPNYYLIVDTATQQYTTIPKFPRQTFAREGANLLVTTDMPEKYREEIQLALATQLAWPEVVSALPRDVQTELIQASGNSKAEIEG